VFTALAKRLLRTADRLSLLARTARTRRRYPGQRVVHREGRWLLAETRPARPVHLVLRELLDLVVDTCAELQLEHAVLPSRDPDSTRVAVPKHDAPALLAALQRRAGDEPIYVRVRGRRRPTLLGDLDLDVERSIGPLRLFRVVALPGGGIHVGDEHGCDLVPYEEVDGVLEFGPDNLVAERVARDAVRPATIEVLGARYPTFEPFERTDYVGRLEVPIDVVYTWVDGDDPAWRAQRDQHLPLRGRVNDEAANASRWIDRDELRYSLRSLHLYAEWVRHVYLVTAGHVPAWLDTTHPGLTVIDHRDIFRDPTVLPTFNSHAIESQLHRIPGLSEHYLYFNDDVHLGQRVPPDLFFQSNGLPRFFPSRYQLDLGPATVDDPPVMAAGKNGRDLLAARYGRVVTQKIKHVPHALRRSTVEELERTFPAEFERTAAARFRSPTDISVSSALAHHYGYLEEVAVPADLRYRYIDLTDPTLPDFLRRLEHERMLQVFCINDTTGTPEQLAARGPLLAGFLDRYFPEPSPFER
jgi:hypothetical protein